jgi:hypothetical protein
MANLSQATDAITSVDMYREGAMILAGMGAAVVAKNVIDSRMDLPDEVYGLGVGGAGAAMNYPMMAAGGFSYSLVKAAERFGVRETVTELGA